MNVYDKFGLKEVINASGKMTILGASTVGKNVIDSQNFGASNFFEMEELSVKSGKYLAKLLHAEDAHIVSSASAGIALCTAAISQGYKKEILLPKGHNVDFGAPIEDIITLGGGIVKEVGYANVCTAAHIIEKITPLTAAVMYVVSHHCVQKSMIKVEEAIHTAHENDLPIIIDCAASEDLFAYTELGADLVIYSGGKAINGPGASGIVLGKSQYIDQLRKVQKGIGRAMKVGKDTILGLTTAIEEYLQTGPESGQSQKQRLRPFIDDINKISGLSASIVQDGAGRDIYRASVRVDKGSAVKIALELRAKSPAIYTREYQANNGILEFDIRAVDTRGLEKIVARLRDIMEVL